MAFFIYLLWLFPFDYKWLFLAVSNWLILYNSNTKEEGRSYISAKLAGAGCRQAVFDDGALEAVLNASDGIPRMINRLCDACLLISHTNGWNTVTADAAMKAINDIQIC